MAPASTPSSGTVKNAGSTPCALAPRYDELPANWRQHLHRRRRVVGVLVERPVGRWRHVFARTFGNQLAPRRCGVVQLLVGWRGSARVDAERQRRVLDTGDPQDAGVRGSAADGVSHRCAHASHQQHRAPNVGGRDSQLNHLGQPASNRPVEAHAGRRRSRGRMPRWSRRCRPARRSRPAPGPTAHGARG